MAGLFGLVPTCGQEISDGQTVVAAMRDAASLYDWYETSVYPLDGGRGALGSAGLNDLGKYAQTPDGSL